MAYITVRTRKVRFTINNQGIQLIKTKINKFCKYTTNKMLAKSIGKIYKWCVLKTK